MRWGLVGIVGAMLLSVVLVDHADARGRRGILKVGKREIADGVAKVYDKNGGYADVRVTNVGRRVPKGAGVRIAEDFGMQEVIHGPRDDRTPFERVIDQQRTPGPYAAPQTYAQPQAYSAPQASYGDGEDYYVEDVAPVCTCPNCGCQVYGARGIAGPSQSFQQASDFGQYRVSSGQ